MGYYNYRGSNDKLAPTAAPTATQPATHTALRPDTPHITTYWNNLESVSAFFVFAYCTSKS